MRAVNWAKPAAPLVHARLRPDAKPAQKYRLPDRGNGCRNRKKKRWSKEQTLTRRH